MSGKLKPTKKTALYKVLLVLVCVILFGCTLTGSVVNRGLFKTVLTDMRLERGSGVKVYYGGSTRIIPLADILLMTLNPSLTATFNDELYFNADITLKDGTRIKSLEKDRSVQTEVFVCVHQELYGKRNREIYRTGFENITSLSVD